MKTVASGMNKNSCYNYLYTLYFYGSWHAVNSLEFLFKQIGPASGAGATRAIQRKELRDMATLNELRLMTKVAKLYYEASLNQVEIAARLGLSQATVSRLYKRAKEEGIIRIVINVPGGVNTALETALEQQYGLKEAIVVESLTDDENQLMRDIGAAAAYYVETTIKDREVVGISSWSASLLALLDAMHPLPNKSGIQVVQVLGGIGNPSAEVHATRLTGRFAGLVNGTAVFLPAPGIVGSAAALKILLEDAYVQEALSLFDQVTMALVGIGSLQPSKLLTLSGNVFSQDELEQLRSKGAVGDILLRFYDRQGRPVESAFNKRVISMQLEQLSRVERSIGVAGSPRKFEAIQGALRGRWINVLITDRATAERLLDQPDS
jgi:DNA-binding transcriptional regulator LsrR (DeoR family)